MIDCPFCDVACGEKHCPFTMTTEERFLMTQVLNQVDTILETDSNHCDLKFLIRLKAELERKLQTS